MSRWGSRDTHISGTSAVAEWTPDVRALVDSIAAALDAHQIDIAQSVVTKVRFSIHEVSEDYGLVQLMSPSAEEGVVRIARVLRDDVAAEQVALRGSATDYIRLFAQRGLSINLLERAHRLTHNIVLQWCLAELGKLSSDAAVNTQVSVLLVMRLTDYSDRISLELLKIYQAELESWLVNRNAARSARIKDILDGRAVDEKVTEQKLGYRLDQHHLGMIV